MELRDPRDLIFKNKKELREAVWKYMELNNLVLFPRPCFGRIPNFIGSKMAAENLRKIEEWENSKVIFSAPDSSLRPSRFYALKEKKILLVVAPKLKGFYVIKEVPFEKAWEASTIRGFSKFGESVKIDSSLPRVCLYITGAVAVDRKGNRIGKGTGFGDKEDLILSRAGLIDEKTPKVVLVHDIQVFDDLSALMNERDRRINIIVTPTGVFKIAGGFSPGKSENSF